MSDIKLKDLYNWCKISTNELVDHPDLKILFRLVGNSAEMGEVIFL